MHLPFTSEEPVNAEAPHLTAAHPSAALPGGHITLTGTHLGPATDADATPTAMLGEKPTYLTLSRPTRAIVTIPEGAIDADLHILRNGIASNALPVRVAVPLIDTVHPVANPAVDRDGNIFVMFSGPRGEKVDVSIYRIDRDFEVRPFIRDLLNVSALAFDRDGYLYASSRAEGTVYRISPQGGVSTYAEGMGIATGLAFDRDGNLFVGDRSGTIFKIGAPIGGSYTTSGEIFVFATLEPSVAAYHLAFLDDGTLLVTGPTTNSHDVINAISPAGDISVYFRGLGRPQGMAVDIDGSIYVVASYQGHRGIVRINPARNAELVLSGDDLVGLAFLEDGLAALTTRSAVFHVDLGVSGRPLF